MSLLIANHLVMLQNITVHAQEDANVPTEDEVTGRIVGKKRIKNSTNL